MWIWGMDEWDEWGQVRRVQVPAWETESPASSISWSMEKAPVDMSSWSRAAALFAEMVWGVSMG